METSKTRSDRDPNKIKEMRYHIQGIPPKKYFWLVLECPVDYRNQRDLKLSSQKASSEEAIPFRDYFWNYKIDQEMKAVFFNQDSRNSFFWCRVPKASSTSWMKLFSEEKGVLDNSK